MDPTRRTGVALFAGAGGMSQGFLDSGFEILLATDHDKDAALTYRQNHPTIPFLKADAKKPEELSGEIILQEIGLEKGQLDVVFGGPPCRGFSTGNRQNGGNGNPHNILVEIFGKLVLELEPRWFVMENVTGLLYVDEGKVRDELIAALGGSYTISAKVLNAADYGVPQIRNRVIFVGSRDGCKFEYPVGDYAPIKGAKKKNKKPYVTVGEAIGDLPRLGKRYGKEEMGYRAKAKSAYQKMMRSGCEKLFNHVITQSNPDVIERYEHIGQGENWSSLSDEMILKWRRTPIEKVKKVSHSNLYLRLDPKEPSVTVGNFRKSMFIHPTENRGLSVREAARLQSFPDWYIFKGGLHSMQQQVGNATPPLLARAVAEKILQALNSEKENADVRSKDSEKVSAESPSLV